MVNFLEKCCFLWNNDDNIRKVCKKNKQRTKGLIFIAYLTSIVMPNLLISWYIAIRNNDRNSLMDVISVYFSIVVFTLVALLIIWIIVYFIWKLFQSKNTYTIYLLFISKRIVVIILVMTQDFINKIYWLLAIFIAVSLISVLELVNL